MSKKEFNKEFGDQRQKPGFKASVLSFFVRIVPKVGPFKALKFRDVGPEGEKLFIKSFDTVLMHYDNYLAKLHNNKVILPDIDYDTGNSTLMGEYSLADQTYGDLMEKLSDTKFNNLTEPLKENILSYYGKTDTLALEQKYPKDWKKKYECLQALRTARTIKTNSLKTAKGLYYKLNEPDAQQSSK